MKRTDSFLELDIRPPFDFGAILIASLVGLMAAVRFWHSFTDQYELPLLSVLFLIGLCVLVFAVLYLNLFFREKIVITADHSKNGAAIDCADLLAVEIVENPFYLSKEWSSAMWGWGGHKLLLKTASGSIRFGRGVSDEAALAMARKIEDFCGRRLLV